MSNASTPSVSRASSFADISSASALHTLLSPDGYYTYLKIPHKDRKKVSAASSFMGGNEEEKASKENEIDLELVKKNYRRLSLRHHPDRRGGDADTFRVLTRAKRVLTVPKLRKEYDLLGLDLDDEEENEDHQEGTADDNSKKDKKEKTDGNENSEGSSTDTVMNHLASATLASIFQAVVRTAMMATASTLICRYKILMIPGILLLCFISYRTMKAAQNSTPPGIIGLYEKVAPLGISFSLYLMHIGRDFPDKPWSWTFWMGEAAVMTFFFLNSVPKYSGYLAVAFFIGSFILTLILRGKFWRYALIICIEAGLAFIAVLAFPIMEMIFEEIMNEKLRKIGVKIRAQSKQVEALYIQQQENIKAEKDLD